MTQEVVTGTISRIEQYGLYVDTVEGRALVLIPDVRQEPTPDLEAVYAIGDEVCVRLLRFVPSYGVFKATMIWSEDDPASGL